MNCPSPGHFTFDVHALFSIGAYSYGLSNVLYEGFVLYFKGAGRWDGRISYFIGASYMSSDGVWGKVMNYVWEMLFRYEIFTRCFISTVLFAYAEGLDFIWEQICASRPYWSWRFISVDLSVHIDYSWSICAVSTKSMYARCYSNRF